MTTIYNQAPLPFVGQKRNFIKHFINVLEQTIPDDGKGWTIIDAFGGSGLLSHVSKRIKPHAQVIYNDFDNYSERLRNIHHTNELRQQLAVVLEEAPRSKKLEQTIKQKVIECIESFPEFVDMKAVSTWIMFSGKYANTIKELHKSTLYNCIRKSNFKLATDYLEGLQIVNTDFEQLLAPQLNNPKCLFILDPPYICTQQGMYANNKYFGMVEFLRLMRLVRPPFIFFSSTRSEFIEYLDFAIGKENNALLAHYNKITIESNVNASARYEDNLIYKSLT